MAVQKLTIDEVKANASNFMYIFADEDKFLRYIPKKFASVIRGKKANQNKVLQLSAKEYGSTYEEYATAVRDGFINDWEVTPAEALVILAQGGEVAGKNWSEGVYGVGALNKEFAGTGISVNPDNGYMMKDGKYLPVYNTVYSNEGTAKEKAYQQFYYDEASGRTYMSQYNKTLKKWYAQSYSTSDGKKYNANGKEITAKDMGTIWESVLLNLQNFLDWLLSIFSGTNVNQNAITAKNTLPNQKTDGFVYESGIGEGGMILLLLAAGGIVASGGLKTKKSK